MKKLLLLILLSIVLLANEKLDYSILFLRIKRFKNCLKSSTKRLRFIWITIEKREGKFVIIEVETAG